MIVIVHGYHLDGSGSCVFVRNMTDTLARMGHDVALLCQEPHPERFDFVADAYRFDAHGHLEKQLTRSSRRPGRVSVYRPHLPGGLLPVYVPGPFPGFEHVVPFTALTDSELDQHFQHSVMALKTVVKQHRPDRMFTNHLVMSPVVAAEVKRRVVGLRHYVIPHGSEIEYLLARDPRYLPLALDALSSCDGIVVGSDELARRISAVFVDATPFVRLFRPMTIGVDAEFFSEPLMWSSAVRLDRLKKLSRQVLDSEGDPSEKPDPDLPEVLDSLDPEKDRLLTFFGRLLPGKGLQDVLVAAPELCRRIPELRIVIAGAGPQASFFRELATALQDGDGDGFERLVDSLDSTGTDQTHPFQFVDAHLASRGRDWFFEESASFRWLDRVVFTGYLSHPLLRLLLGLSDVCVFPSIVKEAYCLAVFEAMAAGAFPIGTDDAGLRVSLGMVASAFSKELIPTTLISIEPERRITELIEHTETAFRVMDEGLRESMVRTIRDRFSWEATCRDMLVL